MKTIDSKAKEYSKDSFFAMYYKQYVNSNIGPVRLRDADVIYSLEWIELKSLSKITDQECEDIQKILRLEDIEAGYPTGYQQVKNALKEDGIQGLILFDFYGCIIEAFQHLISKGYALDDIYGTVAEKVERGWIKLTE